MPQVTYRCPDSQTWTRTEGVNRLTLMKNLGGPDVRPGR
jgi:hypothetical protein